MSDTPETKAFKTRIRGIDGDKHWVPALFAERLERERDEARNERDEQVKLTILVDDRRESAERESIERLSMCVKYKQERDEAKHEIEGWKNKWECAVEMAARAENERDEYRALLIRIYNDINVIHTGEAIRELTRKFRDENFN